MPFGVFAHGSSRTQHGQQCRRSKCAVRRCTRLSTRLHLPPCAHGAPPEKVDSSSTVKSASMGGSGWSGGSCSTAWMSATPACSLRQGMCWGGGRQNLGGRKHYTPQLLCPLVAKVARSGP